MNDYEQGAGIYAGQVLYDLVAGRYLAMALGNEFKEGIEYGVQPKLADYTPAALRNAGIR
ncbi:hypothetical protein D3C76_1670220 [compost metagenome]